VSFRRQPGITGLWEEPFPEAEPSRLRGGPQPFPTGPAAGALSVVGITGLSTPDPLDELDFTNPETEPPPPDRFRIVVFNGYVIKVRDVPQWLAKAKALVAGEMTADKVDRFMPLVWRQRPDRRREVAEEILAHMRAAGKPDIAGAFEALLEKRLPEWREPSEQPEDGLESELA
jgi:hypothetical protein